MKEGFVVNILKKVATRIVGAEVTAGARAATTAHAATARERQQHTAEADNTSTDRNPYYDNATWSERVLARVNVALSVDDCAGEGIRSHMVTNRDGSTNWKATQAAYENYLSGGRDGR